MRGVNGEHDYEMYKEEIESELYYRMTRDSQEHNARMMKEYGAREAWLDSQNVPELPINIEEE